jgi:hypothetical protein
MLQRHLTQPVTPVKEDVDYLLEKIDQLGASNRQPARQRA